MSAELCIHVMTDDLTEEEVKILLGGSLGSKWFDWQAMAWNQRTGRYDAVMRKVSETPHVVVGDVSWLKAALFEGGEDEFVPDTIGAVASIIGEDLPVLDEDLVNRIIGAYELPNRTNYELAAPEPVVEFLRAHQGQRIFTVSW
jgi:hypothetical protein